MEQNIKPFEWLELISLRQSSDNYFSKLASHLNYDDPANLAEILSGCTEILLAHSIDFNNIYKKRSLYPHRNSRQLNMPY